MTRRVFGLSILPLVVLVASLHPVAAAPRETASVKGVVRTASGAGVAGAEVALLDGLRLPIKSAVTGPDGRFSFSEIPTGRLILSVVAPGFERVERVVVAGEEAAAEIVVEPGAS